MKTKSRSIGWLIAAGLLGAALIAPSAAFAIDGSNEKEDGIAWNDPDFQGSTEDCEDAEPRAGPGPLALRPDAGPRGRHVREPAGSPSRPRRTSSARSTSYKKSGGVLHWARHVSGETTLLECALRRRRRRQPQPEPHLLRRPRGRVRVGPGREPSRIPVESEHPGRVRASRSRARASRSRASRIPVESESIPVEIASHPGRDREHPGRDPVGLRRPGDGHAVRVGRGSHRHAGGGEHSAADRCPRHLEHADHQRLAARPGRARSGPRDGADRHAVQPQEPPLGFTIPPTRAGPSSTPGEPGPHGPRLFCAARVVPRSWYPVVRARYDGPSTVVDTPQRNRARVPGLWRSCAVRCPESVLDAGRTDQQDQEHGSVLVRPTGRPSSGRYRKPQTSTTADAAGKDKGIE